MYEPKLIAPFESGGLDKFWKPWLIGQDAFPEILDAYPWRGSVQKREGFDLLGQIKETQATAVTAIAIGTTTTITVVAHGLATGNYVTFTGITGTVATTLNSIVFRITVTGVNTFTLQTVVSGATAFTDVDTTGLAYTAGGVLYLLPPVQGLRTFTITASGATQGLEQLIAFSKKRAYLYNNATKVFDNISFLANAAAFEFSGTDDDSFFYTSNFAGSLWTTKNVSNAGGVHGQMYWNGSSTIGWSDFTPTVSGTTQMNGSLMILPYKQRLVALNTIEGTQNFQNRARWSQVGTPYTSNVVAATLTGGGAGVNITVGNPTIVYVSELSGFVIGQKAGILNVVGTVGNLLNFNQYNVSAKSAASGAGTITIDVDTTGLAYTSGGTAQGPGSINTPPTPFAIDMFAWRDDIQGRGGFNDADTNEKIVAAGIVKDTLVVFFTRSTWRLRYTGNEVLPFIWERLNTQFGSESTFSTIEFDEAVLAFSRYGWIGSDTNDVARVDNSIPDDSFQMTVETNLSGLKRVHGIRDFFRQFAYWTYIEASTQTLKLPNRIYCYNYLNKVWSIFRPQGAAENPNIRVFGTYRTIGDTRWQDLSQATDTWEATHNTWEFGAGEQGFPYIVGGDYNGNVYTMFSSFDGTTSDSTNTMNKTNVGFSITTKRLNPYIDQGAGCKLAYVDVYCTANTGGEITVEHYINEQQESPILRRTVPLYNRGPLPIASITVGVTTTIVTTNHHNLVTGQTVIISSATGTIDNIINNTRFIATVTDAFTFTIVLNSVGFTYIGNAYCNSAILDCGDSKYTRVFLGLDARFHQLKITLTPDQIIDPIKGTAEFELQGLVLWTRKISRLKG